MNDDFIDGFISKTEARDLSIIGDECITAFTAFGAHLIEQMTAEMLGETVDVPKPAPVIVPSDVARYRAYRNN